MWEQLGISLATDIGSGLVGKMFGDDNGYAERKNDAIRNEDRVYYLKQLQDRVKDANAAGLHPMAVLGGSGGGYSPSIGIQGGSSGGMDMSNTRETLRQMGQNTARAEMATKTATERELENLAIERARRENSLLDAQIAQTWGSFLGQPGTPPMPSGSSVGAPASSSGPYRSPAGLIKAKPSESVSAMPGDRGLEAAATPALKRYDLSNNVRVDLPGQQMAESMESLGPLAAPAFGVAMAARAADHVWNGRGKPDDKLLPAGYRWQWSKLKQSWSAVKK